MQHERTRTSSLNFAGLKERYPAWRWHLAAFASICLITVGLAFVAERVSAHEIVRIGTTLDALYITDGFYGPEKSAEHGPYRWTQPLALLTLKDWGPGRIHVTISGIGAAPSEALLKMDGQPVDHTTIEAGKDWVVQGWGTSSSRNPGVSVEGPTFQAPGDARTLGRLVTSLEIYAPEARTRAWLILGLLALGAVLLYIGLFSWFGRPGIALPVCAALPAVFGPLAVYRDRWTEVVAWVVPLVLLVTLVTSRKMDPLRPGSDHSRGGGRTTVLICIAATAALLLLAQGFLNAFDSDRMYQVAAGLGEYGLPTRYPGHDTWTKYGFGQPLLAVPFYYIGKLGTLLGGDYNLLTRFTVSLTNLPIAVFTCWLLYRASRRFAPANVSFAIAATYLLTTPALNYARTFFSEPAGAALLLAALLALVPNDGTFMPSNKRIFIAGACLGAMMWLKPAFVIYWLAPGLVLLVLAIRSSRLDVHKEGAKSGTMARVVPLLKGILAPGLMFAIGPLVATIGQLAYNYLRYGDVENGLFRTGYEKEPGFSTPLLEGLGGLLFSPGKSLFLYAPVLVLAPFGLWLVYRRGALQGKTATTLIIAETAASLLFNALWWAWTGNFAWGPRLIMPVLPLLVWPLASLGKWALDASTGRKVRKVVLTGWVLLAILGACVSIPGALVDFQVYYRLYGLDLAGQAGEAVTIYSPADSPLLVEPGYLLNGLTAAIHRPSLSDAGLPPVWDIVVPTFLALIAVGATRLAARREIRQE